MNKIKPAFTLIEIVMGMGLFALLMVTVTLALSNSLKTSRRAEATDKAKNEGAVMIDRISRDIEFSQSIPVCNSANTLSLVRPDLTTATYTLSGSAILLNGTSISSSGVRFFNHPDCPNMFVCTNSFITVCFSADNLLGSDLSDQASASAGIKFTNQVIRRNNI